MCGYMPPRLFRSLLVMGSTPRERRMTQAAVRLAVSGCPAFVPRANAKRCETMSNVEQSNSLARPGLGYHRRSVDWALAPLQGGRAGFDTQSAHEKVLVSGGFAPSHSTLMAACPAFVPRKACDPRKSGF